MAAAPLANLFNYAYMHRPDPLSTTDPAIQGLIDAGILTQQEISPARTISGEGGIQEVAPDYFYSADPTRLPKTKYGDVTEVRPSQFGDFKLKNENIKYDDPNYGSITPTLNTIDPSSQKNIYDLIGPIMAAVLTAGAGAPWWLAAGLSGAKFLGGLGEDPYTGTTSNAGAIPATGAAANPLADPEFFGHGLPEPAMDTTLPQATTAPGIPEVPNIPGNFSPDLFGDFGSMIAPSDGSAMVASSVAPGAYDNSYGANSSQLIT